MTVPVYGYWSDDYNTKAQMIYPAERLADIQGQTITGLTFFNSSKFHFNNTNIQLSMTETEQSVYEQETANSVPNMIADMPVVANASLTSNDSVLVFTFDEPVLYNGGNLALEVLAVEKSTGVGYDKDYWIGENFSEAYSCYTYGTTSALVYFLPKVQFTTVASEEPQPEPKLGDANCDGKIDVNDVTTVINYILKKNPSPFSYDNANVNADDTVSVMDVTLIIDMILHPGNY
jgi:hypothetical protein